MHGYKFVFVVGIDLSGLRALLFRKRYRKGLLSNQSPPVTSHSAEASPATHNPNHFQWSSFCHSSKLGGARGAFFAKEGQERLGFSHQGPILGKSQTEGTPQQSY